jgi:hypothetical protein
MSQKINARINTLNVVLSKAKEQEAVKNAFTAANGDWKTAKENLKGKLSEKSMKKITLAHSLAEWSDDAGSIVKKLSEKPEITNLRDVALQYNVVKLAHLIDPQAANLESNTVTNEQVKAEAVKLNRKLFTPETTAVIHRMVRDGEIPVKDTTVRSGVTAFFNNLPEFNIRTSSVYTGIRDEKAFAGIDDQTKTAVVDYLKKLQRVQAVSTHPETVTTLMNANKTSAMHIAAMNKNTFMKMFGGKMGNDEAAQVFYNAQNVQIRNEYMLRNMMEAVQGTGVAMIDGSESMEARETMFRDYAVQQGIALNWENLFGNIDYCDCKECNSVYGPASYYVELLQYLRNNDLDPNAEGAQAFKDNPKDIKGTVLEKLFQRRPDLGKLELTCVNTNTVMPYIDLSNEIMESVVVHQNALKVTTDSGTITTSDVVDVWKPLTE